MAGTAWVLVACLYLGYVYVLMFLHMFAIAPTNHNSILSIKLQATLFQNVSAKPISAQSVLQGLRPAHYMSQ